MAATPWGMGVAAAIVVACGAMAAAAAAAAFLATLRALRRTVAREAALRASLVRHREALQQAERKSLNKTGAFAGASHDIRSALAAIAGLVDVSRADARAHPQITRNLDQMDACTKKLLGILNSILDTSKVESGKMQLDEVEFNLADVLEESTEMINIVCISKGLEVVWDPCDLSILRCGSVIGDCRRLKQILDNVLGNSVKFTQEGRVILRAWANRPITRSSISAPSRFGCSRTGANFLCLFKAREHHSDCHSFSLVQNDPDSIEFYFEVDDTGIGGSQRRRESWCLRTMSMSKKGKEELVRLMGGEISIKDKEPGEAGTCVGFNVFTKMGGIHEHHDIEEGSSSIPSMETSESRVRASTFREACSFDGVHCVLLAHGDEARRILRSWMENLGVQVCLVPQLELLASAVEKLCRANTSPARTPSDSFECRTDYCFRPRDTVTQILNNSSSNSVERGAFGGVLVVIDAHYAKMEDMCTEMNFAETKTRIPCKVVCLADANTSSSDLRRFRHATCCDLVLQKPIHGSRLHALLKTLRDLQKPHAQHPSHASPDDNTDAGASAMAARSGSEPRAEDDKPLTGTRVLLVEDTLTLRTIGTRILHQLGASVVVAEDGAKAVSMFEAALEQAAAGSETVAATTPYDVILMDCQMPVMDGYEATGRIREAESRCGIRTPIIALTAHAVEEETRKTILAGMDLHLAEPMERRSIAEAIRRVRGGQG
ncbi:putative histidine kinase 2 [Panicum miliaceum]|uniref:histidine kinase n=1 Tax=Panicum miliaceum TaxID=4540 RepID=A0A3L6TTZ8_PANMI|nr:putative histidine kinase 2 [Panicum miliaceum]